MPEFVPPEGQEDSMVRMAEAQNYAEWLIDRAEPYLGSCVLDFGAAPGTITEHLAATRGVGALEPDPLFQEQLQARFAASGNVSVIADGDQALSELGQEFDSVVCMNVLEHIDDDLGTLQ